MLIHIAAAALNCSGFSAVPEKSVPITVSPIPAAAVGDATRIAEPPGILPTYAIGRLIYGGYGITIRSTDPRLGLIELAGTDGVPRACGHRVEGPTAWDGHAVDRSAGILRFRTEAESPEIEGGNASPQTSIPVLAGYRAGPSTSIGSGNEAFRIGIMHPSRREETIVVAFADRPGRSPARQLASLAMRFEGFAVVPYVHSGALALNLDGRARDGSINRIILDLQPREREAIAAELRRSTK